MTMEYAVGVILALGVGVLGTTAAMERDRAFYAVILIVVATYYDLFAVISGDTHTLGIEIAITAGFIALAVVGFKTSQWVIVAGLLGHTTLDFVHGHVVINSGMPVWWPGFCGTYDAVAAVYLAWRLLAAGARNSTPLMQPAR